jgi:hypothetical protein
MSHWETEGASDEWFTPAYIFEALGCVFDVDVAASASKQAEEFAPCRAPDRLTVPLLTPLDDPDGANRPVVRNVEPSRYRIGIGDPVADDVPALEVGRLNGLAPRLRKECSAAGRCGCYGNLGGRTGYASQRP